LSVHNKEQPHRAWENELSGISFEKKRNGVMLFWPSAIEYEVECGRDKT
jgi:hypothetical protein